MEIKKHIKDLICKHFGHKDFEEVYATPCKHLFGYPASGSDRHYIIFHAFRCERCGRTILNHSHPMRRSELLKNEWFLTKGS